MLILERDGTLVNDPSAVVPRARVQGLLTMFRVLGPNDAGKMRTIKMLGFGAPEWASNRLVVHHCNYDG